MELTWTDNATGEVAYAVRRWCNGAPGETIATLPADSQSYTDTSGSCGSCGYAVQAVGNCGVTSPDAEAVVLDPCAEPLTITCPPTPEPVAVDQDCQGTVPDLVSVTTTAGGRAPISLVQIPAAGDRVEQGSYEVVLTATDANGKTVTCTVPITVADTSPPAVSVSAPVSWTAYPVGKAVSLAGSFVENCAATSAEWSLTCGGDKAVVPGVLDLQAATVKAGYAFTKPGVYAVDLAVTDAAGNTGSVETTLATQAVRPPFVVVYDTEGFVTGGGWFDSPAGSYVPMPGATGKAVLGFTAKYKKKATTPQGNVEFLFKAGGRSLWFHSDDLEWLVVTDKKALLAGVGSVNGQDGYQFILTAVTPGLKRGRGEKDAVRMSIWNEAGVVYDNQPGADPTGDAATPLDGGAIVLHK